MLKRMLCLWACLVYGALNGNDGYKKIKLIVWDLGDTLVQVSILGMMGEIGVRDCACYHLFNTEEENQLQNKIFDVLEEFGGRQTCEPHDISFHTGHRPLPLVMCKWLSGEITDTAQLITDIHSKIDLLSTKNYFRNEREYRIIRNAITSMFTAHVLIRNTRPIKRALKLVEQIAAETHYRQTILSNWDSISYPTFQDSATGQALSQFFDLDNVVISGHLRLLKPQSDMFEYFLKKFNVQAYECLFIDDQEENIRAARRYGFHVIHVKNHDFKFVRKELIRLGIIT